MVATFPGYLQDRVIAGSWSEQRRSHFIEFETESGKPTRSKLPGSPSVDCAATIILDKHEFADLESFYANSVTGCAEGSVAFYMEHPRSGASTVFWWKAPPSAQHISVVRTSAGEVVDLYSVALSLVKE